MSGFPLWVVFAWNGVLGVLFGKASLPRSYRVSGAVFWVFSPLPLRKRRATALIFAVAGLGFLLPFCFFVFQLHLHTPHTFIFILFLAASACILHISRTHMQLHIWGSCSRSWFFLHTQKPIWWLLNGIYLFSNLCVEYPSWRKKVSLACVCVVIAGLTNLKTLYWAF